MEIKKAIPVGIEFYKEIIEQQAEAILAKLGISVSGGINMFYRQIILWRGLPFRPSVPTRRPLSLDEMTREEFDEKMARGLT